MEILLWLSACMIAYPYVGYPLVLLALRQLAPRPVRTAAAAPAVTLIITAHNEARNMRAKLENALALDYPSERLEIIVASDCSDDGTDDIVRSFASRGVELVCNAERRGKVAAQNLAIAHARGDILVFSDARIQISRDSLRAIAENFADPEVGCVSSSDEVQYETEEGRQTTSGEGLYVRYEMWLRELECASGTLVGASGSFYAVRRSLAGVWDPGLTRDFLTPLKVVAAGYRTVSEPRAIGSYRALPEPEAEFRRKVRTVVRGMAVLAHMRFLLNPWRRPGAAFRLWGHKVLRWMVPFWLLGLVVSSAVLAADYGFYALVFAAQVLFYGLAFAGFASDRLESRAIFRLPLFFANVNLSILVAWLRFLSGARQVTWEPTRR